MRRVAFLVFCAFAAPQAFAAGPGVEAAGSKSTETAELYDSFIDSLNIRPSLTSWRHTLTRTISLPSCGDSVRDQRITDAWRRAASKGLSEEAFVQSVRDKLSTAFTADELRALQRLKQSPLGQKVLASERRALEFRHPAPDDAKRQMAEMLEKQKALDGNPGRKQALSRLSAAAGGEDAQLDGLMNIQIGLAMGVVAATPKGQLRPGMDEIVEKIDSLRPMLRSLVSATMLTAVDHLYQQLTTAEIEAYAAQLETDLGRKAIGFIRAAGNEAMRNAMMAVGSEFKKEIDSQDL